MAGSAGFGSGGSSDFNDGSFMPANKPQAPQASAPPVPDPYTSSPGLQPGQKMPGMEWTNWYKSPVSGGYYDKNRSVWENPSFGEVNAQGIVNQYSDPANRPQTTQNTQDFYNQFMANMPTVNSDPGYGTYFQHAKDRTTESINQTMAARGAYGSSAANDQISRAYSDLDAQQAEKEADYNLRRLGENRAWQSLGGSLAGQADQGSLARSGEDRNWESLLGQLGLNSSQLGLSRSNAGQDAANAASAEKSRVGNDVFNQEQSQGDRISSNTLKVLMQMLGMDSEFFDKVESGQIAAGNQAATNERTNAQDTMNYAKTGLQAYDYLKNR